jgi:hypothetical protein
MTDLTLQASTRMSAIARKCWYHSIKWVSLLPLAGKVFGDIATNQCNYGQSSGGGFV